jgi:hypothetical protein
MQEAAYKNDVFVAKVKERINEFRQKEKPQVLRFKRSIQNKTQYLMRISKEQQDVDMLQ